jgi:hypothetical protein
MSYLRLNPAWQQPSNAKVLLLHIRLSTGLQPGRLDIVFSRILVIQSILGEIINNAKIHKLHGYIKNEFFRTNNI